MKGSLSEMGRLRVLSRGVRRPVAAAWTIGSSGSQEEQWGWYVGCETSKGIRTASWKLVWRVSRIQLPSPDGRYVGGTEMFAEGNI